MKRISLNKKSMLFSFICVVVFLFAFYPGYFEEILLIAQGDVFVNLLIATGFCFYILHRQKIADVSLWVITFVIWQIFVTAFNGGTIALAIWGQGVLLICLVLAVQLFYHTSEKIFLKTLYVLFYSLILVNYLSLLLFPEGMIVDQRGISSTNFFLGNYNGFIIYIFIALITGYIYIAKYQKKFQLHYIILWGIVFFTYMRVHSATSVVGLTLLLIYSLLFNRKWTRRFLNIKIYTFFHAIFFYMFVWNSWNSVFLKIVTEVLNKDLTFTGRTLIWEAIKPYIREHWLLGNGLWNGELMAEKIGMVQAVNAHNLYLDIWFKTGLVGFSIIALLFCICCSKLRKQDKAEVRYFLEAFLGILMLMSQFEAYSIKFIFFVLVFISAYADHNRRGAVRT